MCTNHDGATRYTISDVSAKIIISEMGNWNEQKNIYISIPLLFVRSTRYSRSKTTTFSCVYSHPDCLNMCDVPYLLNPSLWAMILAEAPLRSVINCRRVSKSLKGMPSDFQFVRRIVITNFDQQDSWRALNSALLSQWSVSEKTVVWLDQVSRFTLTQFRNGVIADSVSLPIFTDVRELLCRFRVCSSSA